MRITEIIAGSMQKLAFGISFGALRRGIDVNRGWPGKRFGHVKKMTSYFDRLWTKGDHVDAGIGSDFTIFQSNLLQDRYFFMVERPGGQPDERERPR